MKILHLIIIFGSVLILSISSGLVIIDGNKAQGIISKELTPGGVSQELVHDLANHGYAIVPSNTTEWLLWYNHYNDIVNYSDTIFTGTIVSKNILNITSFYTVGSIKSTVVGSMEEGTYYITGPPYKKINYTLNLDQYAVHVDKFLKNLRSYNMTVRAPIIDPNWNSGPSGPRFNVGDHVLFYVKKLDGANVYSQMSFSIPQACNAWDVLYQERWSGSILTMKQDEIHFGDNLPGGNNIFAANKPIQFMYSGSADTLFGKDTVIKYELFRDPSNEIVLSKLINASSKKCEWNESANWELSLESGDYYSVQYEKNDNGTFVSRAVYSFSVNPDATNTSLSSSNPNSEKIPIAPDFRKYFQTNENKTDWNYEHQLLRYLLATKTVIMPNFQMNDSISTPPFVKNTYDWWLGGQISDEEFIQEIQYLMDSKIITSSSVNTKEIVQEHKILAINLATNSSIFQSMTRGYNYTFVIGGSSCEEFTSYNLLPDCIMKEFYLQFVLYNGTKDYGYNVLKVVNVWENPTLTRVLKVTESNPVWS